LVVGCNGTSRDLPHLELRIVSNSSVQSTSRKFLKEYVGERKSGFLFSTRNGKPIASSNVIRRHLHPALENLKYVNQYTGNHKAGNHAFRRFRNTYLRNHTECPEGLYKYWMGHAGAPGRA